METYFKVRIAELVILFLVLLNVFDFFNFLSGDMSFIKEMMSILLMTILFYRVGMTWLFFGTDRNAKTCALKNKLIDALLILSFLSFLLKDVIVIGSEKKGVVFASVMLFLKTYASQIEIFSVYFGGALLLILSVYLALFSEIKDRSFLGNIHIKGRSFLVKLMAIFLVLTAFYILVFDLVFEWLAVAIDNTLIMTAIFVYVAVIIRYHKHFSAEHMIYKIGSFSDEAFEKMLKFFHDKSRLFLGISALLVLHVLTEISNFLIPYIIDLTSSMYFEKLGHESIYALLASDISFSKIYIPISYIFNVIALLALMLLSAFIWHELYKKKREGLPGWAYGIFFASLPSFILTPLFSFKAISAEKIAETGLVGVDIIAKSVIHPNLKLIVILSIVFGLAVFALSRFAIIKKLEYHAVIISTLAFMFYYLFLFYSSTASFYTGLLKYLLTNSMWFLLFFFSVFYAVKIAFIVFGSIKFVVQIIRNHII